MRIPFELPGSRLTGIWFAAPDDARGALPQHVDQELSGRVWKEFVPRAPIDHREVMYGDVRLVRAWSDPETLKKFGVVVEFGSDWGPSRLILPEVHVPWGTGPYALSVQFRPDVVDRLRRMGRENSA